MYRIRRVCVYCGSNSGNSPAYLDAAAEMGRCLAQLGIGVVYGGGHRGLMGKLADSTLASGGEVIGIIPTFLRDLELAHSGLSELRVVDTMHERKATMAGLADAFIALPGGIGTLEEIFEVWTWTQLGAQAKPVGLLNVCDFFGSLIAFLDQLVNNGFLQQAHRDLLQVSKHPGELVAGLAAFESTFTPKEISRL
jgi:uncharacterized protein (TIGR00730 family)